jgi:hypothetical protein
MTETIAPAETPEAPHLTRPHTDAAGQDRVLAKVNADPEVG